MADQGDSSDGFKAYQREAVSKYSEVYRTEQSELVGKYLARALQETVEGEQQIGGAPLDSSKIMPSFIGDSQNPIGKLYLNLSEVARAELEGIVRKQMSGEYTWQEAGQEFNAWNQRHHPTHSGLEGIFHQGQISGIRGHDVSPFPEGYHARRAEDLMKDFLESRPEIDVQKVVQMARLHDETLAGLMRSDKFCYLDPKPNMTEEPEE